VRPIPVSESLHQSAHVVSLNDDRMTRGCVPPLSEDSGLDDRWRGPLEWRLASQFPRR